LEHRIWTTPLRRTILHLVHIFLTDALTFMCNLIVRLPISDS
jgi:hypothetical protein